MGVYYITMFIHYTSAEGAMLIKRFKRAFVSNE